MFVGRQKELSMLHGQYQSDRFELAVLLGRRRIGKTYLLKAFIKNVEGYY